MNYNEVLEKRAKCKHDKDLIYGLISSTFYGSDDYDQDINCSECDKRLYFIESDRKTIWKYGGVGKNPIKIDPKTYEDRRLVRFVGSSIHNVIIDLMKECENEIRMKDVNREGMK